MGKAKRIKDDEIKPDSNTQHVAIRLRIYPTKEQENFLSNQFGGSRFIYNLFLNRRKDEYMANKKSSSYFNDAKYLTELKRMDGYEWLYSITGQSLQCSLRNLEVAYSNFFLKRAKFPKFHAKKSRQSIKIPQSFYIEEKKLYIPKLKSGIKIKFDKRIQNDTMPEKAISCSITKETSGKYYASFICEMEKQSLPISNNIIGIDLGLKDLIVSSNGEKIKSPNFYRKSEKKIKYQQRQLSKKKKGSNNRKKQQRKLALTHEKIANKRKDFIHNISKKLINENQVIIAESLAVKNMMKNHHLAKSIMDASWVELIRQLKYKADWFGRAFHQIDRFFPSSKTCSSCNFIVDKLPLNIRKWSCTNCKMEHDRDINAAINIKNQGINDLGIFLNSPSGSGIESDVKQKLVPIIYDDGHRMDFSRPMRRRGKPNHFEGNDSENNRVNEARNSNLE